MSSSSSPFESAESGDHMRLRTGKRVRHREREHALPRRTRPWRMPAYHQWPSQSEGPAFVRFVGTHLAKYGGSDGPDRSWRDNCILGNEAFLDLLPFQQFLAQIVSPKTTLRRVLVAASTGSGKTMVVAQILCNFLQHDYEARTRVVNKGKKRPTYVPAGQPKPSAVYVITQNAKLREDLWATIQEKARCARRPGQDFQKGRLNEELHPYWWAERWFASHDVPVHVLTYGAAINRSVRDFAGAVVVLDEAHTLVDTSALVLAQRNAVLRLLGMLRQADPQVLIGLTGTPLGRGWRDFIEIHNLFCASHADRLDARTFAASFLKSETVTAEQRRRLELCLGKDARDVPTHYDAWSEDVDGALEKALRLKIAPYMFYYDGSFDVTRFARAVQRDPDAIRPSREWMVRSQYTSAGKPRANMVRTRLVAVDNTTQGTEAIVRSIASETDLERVAPVVHRLLQTLADRRRKAVIYSDVYAPLGATFVYHALQKFKASFADASAPILYLRNDDTKPDQRRVVQAFNRHPDVGRSSAILVLGPSYSTGIDLHGAAGEFHLLNVLPNFALEQQARGRVHRSCSHRGLPREEWRIFYYQYLTTDEDEEGTNVFYTPPSTLSKSNSTSGGGGRGPGCSKHRKADCVGPACAWDKGRCRAVEVRADPQGVVTVPPPKEDKKKKNKKEPTAADLPLLPPCDRTIADLRRRQDSVMVELGRIIRQASLGCAKLAAHHRHPPSDCEVSA